MSKRLVSVGDHKNIVIVVTNYIEAIKVGNIDMLANAFHKDSVTYGIVDGELVGGSDNPSAKFIEINGASPEIEFHIDVLDMSPTTAVVRVVTAKDAIGSNCNEYLTLIKTNKGWTIISKVFVQFDK